MTPKPLWKSKTFWFNTLTFAAHYTGYLPAHWVPYVTAVGNIVLRFLTTQPVTLVP